MDYIAEELRPLAVPVTELHPDPKNARGHDERSLAVVKNSLERFGCRTPICTRTNEDGQRIVIAGNARLEAAIELGWSHMPCVSADGDDDAEAILYALTDNRSAELSHWDQANLAEVMANLEYHMGIGDDDLKTLGWSDEELEALMVLDRVEPTGLPDLPDNDDPTVRHMTFTVHNDQHTLITEALENLISDGHGESALNNNRNGNALAELARRFLGR